MNAVAAVKAELADVPVVDTHAHLRALRDLRPMSLTKLISDSFVKLCLRSADGSPNALGSTLDVSLEEDSWETLGEIAERVRFTSFYRWLMLGVAELYDLERPELARDTWQQLSADIRARYESETWLAEVLDRGRIQAVIWDPFWIPGQTETPDARVLPSLRVTSSMAAFHPEASDYEGANVVRDWASSFGMAADSLDDLEILIDKLLDLNLRAGARSLKFPNAYERTLAVGSVERSHAKRIFGRPPDHLSQADRLLFGDYIIRFYLDRAREHGLVIQVHTGLARLEDSNPLQLLPLLREYPDIVFDLFHGGYPWIREMAALAHSYPNVRLNLVWLPQLSTRAAVSAIKEWIEVVPQVHRICWGGDSRTPEETYGSLLAGKHAIAHAVGELVDEEYLSFDDAIEVARSILSGAAVTIYNL